LAKPDIDNLLKAVMDGLTESGVINDDAQIFEQHAVKVYHALGEMPKAVIELAWADCIND
jgi:Holliday junction resolvase RusA-like endonuclease